MTHEAHAATLAAPARVNPTAPAWIAGGALAAIGAGAFGYALATEQYGLAWSAWLIGSFLALGLGVFGTLWTAILYLSKGVWSVTMRRIPEAMSAWLLPGSILTLVTGLAGHHLYEWMDAGAVAADRLLTHKSPFLNPTTFYVLVGLSFALWIVFNFLLLRNSRQQDTTGSSHHTRRNVTLSALFVVFFALTFSAVSFYFLMSLEPHWFSTMFAVLTFTDVMQTGTAFVTVVVAVMVLQKRLGGFVTDEHLHQVAKMMFATTGFWAYIYFCQFLLIWYANLPEETTYFLRRVDNGWAVYTAILPFIKFVIPFIYLVPRSAKREPKRVLPAALLLLVAQVWELFILVAPAVGHGEHASHGHLPIVEGAVALGFLGAFALVAGIAYSRHDPVPLKDPYIAACLHQHS